MSDTEFRILSKAELREKGQPASAVLPLPELGDRAAVKVRGFSLGDILDIQAASTFRSPDGVEVYDNKQDVLLSLIRVLEEPKIGLEDTDWVQGLTQGVVDRIIGKARELGHSTPTAYEELKAHLRANPYVRRIYSICANKLGRLPSELTGVSEAEFNTLLAVLELDTEEQNAADAAAIQQLHEG
jgi:hypothetical protein